MPQVQINSVNIGTFRFSVTFDIYQRKITFDASLTSYNGSSGSGIFNVLGIGFSLKDQEGLELASIDFANQIPSPASDSTWVLDLSDSGLPFFFTNYRIVGAIKDANGTIYETAPVFVKVCEPVNNTEQGYVPGMFQVVANCADNFITVKELSLLIYDNKKPVDISKAGTLYYPTGTISPVSFTGTPFTNDQIYTGENRVNCETVATYDMGQDIFVAVTYITGQAFPVTCGNKMMDLMCCLTDLEKKATINCDNAEGKWARQQQWEILPYFVTGLAKELNGQDASYEADYIKKKLNCNCGQTSLGQNEVTPVNPAVQTIVLNGVGGTTVPAVVINGNTKTYSIASNVYKIGKGNPNDLAFTITTDTSAQYLVQYNITFNYTVQAQYILAAIAADGNLLATLNSLIVSSGGNVNLTGLNGRCVISLGTNNYFLSQNATAATIVSKITIAGIDHTVNLPASNPSGIQTLLNGLGLGTFSVTYGSGSIGIASNSNANVLNSVTFLTPNLTVPFQSTNASLVTVLQAMIDYLCGLTALQIALGNNLTLWQIDYNGNMVSQGFGPLLTQNDFNAGIANSVYNIIQRIYSLTSVTCAKVKAVFPERPNGQFTGNARIFGIDVNGDCTAWTPQQIAMGVVQGVSAFADVKTEFCAIDCSAPALCPDISAFSANVLSGDIALYGVTWATTPQATQVTTVKYKKSTDSNYTLATNSLQVFANGNINGVTPFLISGLTPGETYDVWWSNGCGGTGKVQQVTIPTGTVYSNSYLLDVVIYNICGQSPSTLYSNAPFAPGVILYNNVGLTVPVTGFTYVALASDGEIFTLNSGTGLIGASTGSSCSTGTVGKFILSNAPGTVCSSPYTVLYTNGPFAVGGILYLDSALTTPVTGYSYVLWNSNKHIYNLNSVTGQIGADTGSTCSVYSGSFRRANDVGTVCSNPVVTLYTSEPFNGVGTTVYTNVGLSTPLTGFAYIKEEATTKIWQVNIANGVVLSYTGIDCVL